MNEVVLQINAHRTRLCEQVVSRVYEMRPELSERYGEKGRAHCLKDTDYHLSYLCEALEAGESSLFLDYLAWARALLAGYGIPTEDLILNLQALQDALKSELPPEMGESAGEYLQVGMDRLPGLTADPQPHIEEGQPLQTLAESYINALLNANRHLASLMILDAVKSGISVKEIYLNVFQPCQYEIGRRWQRNEISVAQEHFASAATQFIMTQLYPYIVAGERKERMIVAACVGGDLHDIGVRMVADFFEMDGWNTIYLGANTPTAGLVQMVCERGADVLALSVTMTYHLREAVEVIQALRKSDGCENVKILVGGYPFRIAPDLWRHVGADGFANDAEQAVALANRLIL